MPLHWIITAAVIVGIYAWYASLVGKRNKVREALAGVDVQLKQRADLIPNILVIAKKFMEHEQSLFSKVTELRSRVLTPYDSKQTSAVQAHLNDVNALSEGMRQLAITMENYPALKSDQTMAQAMQTNSEVEAQITAARRFYNSAVNDLNNAVQIFPGNLIARLAGISEMPFFAAEEADKKPVSAAEILK